MEAKTLGLSLQRIFILILGIVSMYWMFGCVFSLLVPNLILPCVPGLIYKQVCSALLFLSICIFCCAYFVWNDNVIATVKFKEIILPILLSILMVESFLDAYISKPKPANLADFMINYQDAILFLFVVISYLIHPKSENSHVRKSKN